MCVYHPRLSTDVKSGWFSSCVCTLLSVLYWIFELAEHLRKKSHHCTLYSHSSLSKDCDHILWHSSSVSKPNITVSTSDMHRLCASWGVCGFFENVKIQFVFHFHAVSVLVHRYSYQGNAAGACIAKYQSVCQSVSLSVFPSVHLCDCPACLSDCLLCHFFPPSLLFS